MYSILNKKAPNWIKKKKKKWMSKYKDLLAIKIK